MKIFPEYEFHADVRCFNCGRKMSGQPVPSGEGDVLHNPPGYGRYRQHCERCGMWTYYDIVAPKGTPYQPNLLRRSRRW